MMNRSSSSSNPPEPYVPSSSSNSMIMSFANGHDLQAPQQNQQLQALEYLYWDQSGQQNQTPTYSFEPVQPPPPLPMNNAGFHFHEQYQHPAATNYMVKREDQAGRIGLNLGHRTYFSSADALAIDSLLSARAHQQQQQQQPRCQVEGCNSDLSEAKNYHRRHKICEFHSKATFVVAGGTQQRFCQQCSRFHVLGEFDESKRSCRKRLADHNRRRRKAQNHPATTSNNSTEEMATHTATRPSSSKTSPEYTTASWSTSATTIRTAICSDNDGGFLDNSEGMGPRSDQNQSLHHHHHHHFSGTSTYYNNNSSSSSSSRFNDA